MRRGYLVIAGLALVAALAYISWLNPETAELRLSQEWLVRAPLAALLIVAALAGATVVLLVVGMRASGRAFSRWRARRRERPAARAQARLAEGRRLMLAGDIDRGRALLLRAWRDHPTPDIALALADAYLATDHVADARRVLQDVNVASTDNPDLLLALAEVCSRQGDTAAAIRALELAHSRFPRALAVLRPLRDLYIDAERWSEAASVQAELLVAGAAAPVPSQRAILAGARYEAAVRVPGRAARLRALEEVAAEFPTFVPATLSLGDELVAAGRIADALRLWESAFRQQPRGVLAERLAQHGTDRAARDRLRTLLRRLRGTDAERTTAHLLAARFALEDKDLDAAARELEAVPNAARQDTPYVLLDAELNARRAQHAQAFDAYRRALAALPAYHCGVCERPAPTWRAYCTACRRWDTFRSRLDFAQP